MERNSQGPHLIEELLTVADLCDREIHLNTCTKSLKKKKCRSFLTSFPQSNEIHSLLNPKFNFYFLMMNKLGALDVFLSFPVLCWGFFMYMKCSTDCTLGLSSVMFTQWINDCFIHVIKFYFCFRQWNYFGTIHFIMLQSIFPNCLCY